MIELRNLSQSFLKKDLFANVSLRLFKDHRYGVVGANGCGKSTLLKIITGEILCDDGEVVIDPMAKVFRIGQDYNLDDEQIILDIAMMGQLEVFLALEKLKTLTDSHEVVALEEIISKNDGYRLKSKAKGVLLGLGIKEEFHDKPLKVLSGGYKWRCFLAQCLVKNPDILLLDEPTNHLDIISIRWLELFLCNYDGLVMIVSHDKKFMDQVCTDILDIDFGTIRHYVGNYEKFEKARQLFLLQKEKEILSQRKEIDKKMAFVEKFRAKASKARQAQSRLKQIEKIIIEEPISSLRIHPKFAFLVSEPGSKEVLVVKSLSKNFLDKSIINNFSFSVQRKEKIAMIGANGTGKSTLIKALAGEFLECRSKVKWGMGVNMAYFPQDAARIIKEADPHKNALEWLWQYCPGEPQSVVQGMLGRVLLSGDDAKKSVRNLSGGELGRLYLAMMMLKKPNVLLLDEPTNHLDVESIESLSQALMDYVGTIIMVSHDRDFVQKIAQRIFEIEPNKINEFLGSYDDFVKAKERDYLDREKESKVLKEEKVHISINTYEENKKKKSLLQKLKKDLEKNILAAESLEKQIHSIEHELSQENFYTENSYDIAVKKQQEKEILEKELQSVLNTWEALEKDIENLA